MNEFQDFQWQSGDGLQLYARDYAAEGAKCPVICLHGLTRNSRDFEAIAPKIQALGRRVLAPDFRGRGRSEYDPDPKRYVPPVYAADIVRLCEQLEISSFAAIGTSLGGIVTMILANTQPDKLVGAVLNDIGPVIDKAGMARIRGYVGKSRVFDNWDAAADAVRNVNASIYPDFDESDWLALAKRTFRVFAPGRIAADYDPAIAVPFADADNNAAFDPWDLFTGLQTIPTLAIRGALSDLMSADTLATMKQRKPDLETVVVDNRGHPPLLTEPDAWQAIERLLSRLP